MPNEAMKLPLPYFSLFVTTSNLYIVQQVSCVRAHARARVCVFLFKLTFSMPHYKLIFHALLLTN